jgi:hypothetical protein
MEPDRIWALSATAVALATAGRLFWTKVRNPIRRTSTWTAPSPDPGRYQVVMHINGETREIFHGYDALKARHAFEFAPMEAGMSVEFYEWGERRGKKDA